MRENNFNFRGKPKQAQGNAIERLGKNLIGIKAMMNHERIRYTVFERREIKPDGGIIALHKKDDDRYIKIVLISEVKRQGYEQRKGWQKVNRKQAQGNDNRHD